MLEAVELVDAVDAASLDDEGDQGCSSGEMVGYSGGECTRGGESDCGDIEGEMSGDIDGESAGDANGESCRRWSRKPGTTNGAYDGPARVCSCMPRLPLFVLLPLGNELNRPREEALSCSGR